MWHRALHCPSCFSFYFTHLVWCRINVRLARRHSTRQHICGNRRYACQQQAHHHLHYHPPGKGAFHSHCKQPIQFFFQALSSYRAMDPEAGAALFKGAAANQSLKRFETVVSRCSHPLSDFAAILSDNYTLQYVCFQQTTLYGKKNYFEEVTNRNKFLRKQQRFKSVKPAPVWE